MIEKPPIALALATLGFITIACVNPAPAVWLGHADRLRTNPLKAPEAPLEAIAVSERMVDPSTLAGHSIEFYQENLSGLWGSRCRYLPSCSRYGQRLLGLRGPWVGTAGIAGRIISCNDQAADFRPAYVLEGRTFRTDWPHELEAIWQTSSEGQRALWIASLVSSHR